MLWAVSAFYPARPARPFRRVVLNVTLPDGSTKQVQEGATTRDVADAIGPRLGKDAVAGRITINGHDEIVDLNRPLPGDCTLRILTRSDDDEDSLNVLRHSAAHVMAEAICILYPGAQLVYGPPVENGFYYDIDLDESITSDAFERIEAEMKRIIAEDRPFRRYEMQRDQAMPKLEKEGNPYKIDNAQRAKGDTLSFYVTGPEPGRDFEDLCRGPHIPSTGMIRAVKVQQVSAAYYRGDAQLQSLQRVYGTAFFKKRSLDEYLQRLEEAKKRDHRKLGAELDLFVIDENVGIGLPLWLPKGMIIREQLEALAKETEQRAGYQRVATPHITKGGLYETSGHLAHYKDSMFPPMNVDGEDYYLKPMNCPHHHMIFRARPRSYRDLPLRLAEYGTCYRYEKHGELAGMLRVRCMTMNDAHIYCTLDQLKDEFKAVMDLHKYYYELLGLGDYYMRLSLHDPANSEKYVGDPEMWTMAEKMVQEAMTESGIPFKTVMGEAAFYGPKIDVQFKNVVGREESNSTNQVDFVSAKRFDLNYVGADNQKHHPVILHRAPLGTHERFVAFLIEHYAGIFPLWLAPVQVGLVTISEKSVPFGRTVHQALTEAGLRAELDDSSEKIGPKKHRLRAMKIPYIVVVGEREAADGTVNVNNVHGQTLGTMPIKRFVDGCAQEVAARSRQPFFKATE